MKTRIRTVNQRFCRVTLGLGWPRFLAWLATVVAIVLALLPRGGWEAYDAGLAVLTATLVAVVWAAFFAFRSVNPPAAVQVGVETKYQRNDSAHLLLRPWVKNPSGRAIRVQVFLNIWIDSQPTDVGGFYRGERAKVLGPNDGFSGHLDLTSHLKYGKDEDAYGNRRLLTKEVLVETWVEWIDDLCEQGAVEPKHWRIETTGEGVSAVIDPQRVTEFFGGLPRTCPEPTAD